MLSIRTFINELYTWEWLAILLARLAVGLLFFLSGRGKLFVAERRQQMRQTLLEAHVPFPDFNTILRLDGGIRLRLVSRNRGSQHLSPA